LISNFLSLRKKKAGDILRMDNEEEFVDFEGDDLESDLLVTKDTGRSASEPIVMEVEESETSDSLEKKGKGNTDEVRPPNKAHRHVMRAPSEAEAKEREAQEQLEKEQRLSAAKEKAKLLRDELKKHIRTLTQEEYNAFLALGEQEDTIADLAIPIKRRRISLQFDYDKAEKVFWKVFHGFLDKGERPFRKILFAAEEARGKHLDALNETSDHSWQHECASMTLIDEHLSAEIQEYYARQDEKRHNKCVILREAYDRKYNLPAEVGVVVQDWNWLARAEPDLDKMSSSESEGGNLTTENSPGAGAGASTPISDSKSTARKLESSLAALLSTAALKRSSPVRVTSTPAPVGVTSTPAPIVGTTPAVFPARWSKPTPPADSEPQWGATWHSSAAVIGSSSASLKENTEIKIKENGIEIIIPKLLKLSDLPAWLRRITQVRETLATQVVKEEDMERYLNLNLLLSDEARVEISAILLAGRDIRDFTTEELFTALTTYAQYQSESTPTNVLDVLKYIKEHLKGPAIWRYSYSGLVVSCERWVSDAYFTVYAAINALKCQLATRVVTQLFVGCFEPAEFRQHLVLRIDEMATRGEEIKPVVGAPVIVSWESIESILQVALVVGREVDTLSRTNANHFATLGTSPDHKTKFRLLEPNIRELAKPLRLEETEHGRHRAGKRERFHSPPVARREYRDKRARTTPSAEREPRANPNARPNPAPASTAPKTCRLCNELGHRAVECPRGTCYPGCHERPSKAHDPYNCDFNPVVIARRAAAAANPPPPETTRGRGGNARGGTRGRGSQSRGRGGGRGR
jgi:hypothetical protein